MIDSMRLVHIESMDPSEQHVYASLNISGTPREGRCHFVSSNGVTVDCNYEIRRLNAKLNDTINGVHRKEEFNYLCPPILTSVKSPFYRDETTNYSDRFLLESHSGKNKTFISRYSGFGKDFQSRVKTLSFPVGQDDSFVPIYEIDYKPPIEGKKPGLTQVKDCDGNLITYHFSKNLLITSIQYFGKDNGLKKEHLFNWNDKNRLTSVEIRDGEKNLHYKKSFELDSFGNPIKEILTGNFSGNGVQESCTIQREFSQDGYHLLLKEEQENGKGVYYSYLPETNLPVTKLTQEHGRIILREFSFYDEFRNLIRTITDDGNKIDPNDLSGITERRITDYALRQNAPFLHMPEWIEEKYWDNGVEKLLKRKHLIYDSQGNVAVEEIYDANNQLAYTLYKEYNERGDL
ncbi:MAG: hypothetical protein ACHQUC_10990, partial [Chlamydiales bacterium]